MSKQNRKIPTPLILLVVTLGICIFAVILIRELFVPPIGTVETNPTPDPLEARLSEMVSSYKSGEIAAIDISTLTTFSWDRLYIFGPYAVPLDLYGIVGTTWRNIDSCSYGVHVIETSQGYTLFVFTDKAKVVYCLTFPRDEASFYITEQEYKSGFLRQEALFVLDDRGGMFVKDK